MSLIAIPNLSEGKDPQILKDLALTVTSSDVRLLDVHSDEIHNRTVFTVAGEPGPLAEAMGSLAATAARLIDLTRHTGVHPRLGVLDVCPFVPLDEDLGTPVAVAGAAARLIGNQSAIPVFLYGAAARRAETQDLPGLRAGGLEGLTRRLRAMPPDEGPATIDPRTGVVCIGARLPLIAFNVWLDAPEEAAVRIAASVRTRGGGRPGVRALGLRIDGSTSQVSMNLIDPRTTGIDDAYDEVATAAQELGVGIAGTEIVGLPPRRFMPDPKREAARRLISPGRSLESALTRS